jgi:hypothetical protein
VNGGSVYWGNGSSGFLYKESIQGPPITTLASGSVSGASESDAVTDGTNVYYIGNVGLMKVPIEGGNAVELVHDQGTYAFGGGGDFPLAVDGTSVYVIAGAGSAIVKVAK